MYAKRYDLSAAQWGRVESFLPGRAGWVGVTPKDNRPQTNGICERFHKILQDECYSLLF